jgi:phosphate uptake regulator
MPFSQRKFIKFQNGMRRRIESLRPKAEESLELAVDTMMQERVDSFFRVEQGLEEIIKSLVQIEEEIIEIRDLSASLSKTDGTISTARYENAPVVGARRSAWPRC